MNSPDSKPSLEFSFSTQSAAPCEKSLRAFSPSFTTRQTALNLVEVQRYLGMKISASFHLGTLADIKSAGKVFTESGIAIASLDKADAYQPHDLIKDIAKQVFQLNAHGIVYDIARFFHNVPFDWMSHRQIHAALRHIPQLGSDDRGIILRTHAGHWTLNGGRTGDRLRKTLRGTGVVLALEIFAETQTQTEYYETVEKLATDNGHDTPVYFDMDLGHMKESAWKQRHRSEGKEPLACLEDTIRNNGKDFAATSLNQYENGAALTHGDLFGVDASIDLIEAAGILGRAARNGHIHPRVLTVVESSPFRLCRWFSPEAVFFVNAFKSKFEENAGILFSSSARAV